MRKKWLSPISNKQRERLKEYATVRTAFLSEHPNCAVFPTMKSTEVHHSRGRAGTLLTDTRFFVAVSRKGHLWIDNNREKARELGLLCARGQWNTPVPLSSQ